MALSLHMTPNALVVRRGWSALAVVLALGLGTVAGAVMMWNLASDRAGDSRVFLLLPCASFALVGFAVFVRTMVLLARQGVQAVTEVLRATRFGLAITPVIGASTQRLSWSEVEELAAVDRFRIVEADGTTRMWNVLVVFFEPRRPTPSLLEQAKVGYALSGTRRPFRCVSIPRGAGQTVVSALREMVPSTVRLSFHPTLVFDLQAGTDASAV